MMVASSRSLGGGSRQLSITVAGTNWSLEGGGSELSWWTRFRERVLIGVLRYRCTFLYRAWYFACLHRSCTVLGERSYTGFWQQTRGKLGDKYVSSSSSAKKLPFLSSRPLSQHKEPIQSP